MTVGKTELAVLAPSVVDVWPMTETRAGLAHQHHPKVRLGSAAPELLNVMEVAVVVPQTQIIVVTLNLLVNVSVVRVPTVILIFIVTQAPVNLSRPKKVVNSLLLVMDVLVQAVSLVKVDVV